MLLWVDVDVVVFADAVDAAVVVVVVCVPVVDVVVAAVFY